MSRPRILFVVALSAAVIACARMGAQQPRMVQANWSVAYGCLSGPVQAARLHEPATPGLNAGVALPMPVTFSPMVGSATLIDAMAAGLLGGRLYVDLHTPTFLNGEISGRVLGARPIWRGLPRDAGRFAAHGDRLPPLAAAW